MTGKAREKERALGFRHLRKIRDEFAKDGKWDAVRQKTLAKRTVEMMRYGRDQRMDIMAAALKAKREALKKVPRKRK
jgi:hypothetical protein